MDFLFGFAAATGFGRRGAMQKLVVIMLVLVVVLTLLATFRDRFR